MKIRGAEPPKQLPLVQERKPVDPGTTPGIEHEEGFEHDGEGAPITSLQRPGSGDASIPIATKAPVSTTESARLATLEGIADPTSINPVRNKPASELSDDELFLRDMVRAYYPIDHPNLHIVDDGLNLDRLPGLGRTDETGRLRKVALAVPYALGGEWKFSPLAQAKGFEFDLDKALEQHSRLTKFLLDRGVEVYLQLQPEGASEAVYATDSVTGVGKTAFIGNPKHEARKLETDAYEGGVPLAKFGGADGPIEFGDVLLFHKDGKQYVFQGYNSWRGTTESIEAMRVALSFLERQGQVDEVVHVPIELSGEGTLHLDYVFNYAGTGDKRIMTVYPEGLADPSQADALARILDVPEERVIRVTKEEMLDGAANLSSFGPDEVMYIDNAHTARVAAEMRKHGLNVTQFEYDQMSQKDGTLHCCIGQLDRD